MNDSSFCLFVFALITYWFISKWTNPFLSSLLFVCCLLNLILIILSSTLYVGGGNGINYLILLISSGWTFFLNNNFIFWIGSIDCKSDFISPIGYWSIDQSIFFYLKKRLIEFPIQSISKFFFSQIDWMNVLK